MERASEFSIIHNHFDFLPLSYSRLIKPPVITTIHGFSSPQIVPVFKKYNKHTSYVSISNSDRHPELQYLDTVYNGIDEKQFEYGDGEGDYLLYFGRIHPDKGAHEAIRIAVQSKRNLVLCGLIQDESYFKEMVSPFLNDTSISYKGNVGPEERKKLLGNAMALLHPINFEEPFGLSVVEAMMCGTPVIAFDRGAMKELIVDQQTGFLVKSVHDAVLAVGNIKNINRHNCRMHSLERFSSQVMARHYIKLYREIVGHCDNQGSGL
jgi:glycosyltransferase involved in cell wall biosynthesis